MTFDNMHVTLEGIYMCTSLTYTVSTQFLRLKDTKISSKIPVPLAALEEQREMLLGGAVNDCFALRIKFVGGGDPSAKRLSCSKFNHAANWVMHSISTSGVGDVVINIGYRATS